EIDAGPEPSENEQAEEEDQDHLAGLGLRRLEHGGAGLWQVADDVQLLGASGVGFGRPDGGHDALPVLGNARRGQRGRGGRGPAGVVHGRRLTQGRGRRICAWGIVGGVVLSLSGKDRGPFFVIEIILRPVIEGLRVQLMLFGPRVEVVRILIRVAHDGPPRMLLLDAWHAGQDPCSGRLSQKYLSFPESGLPWHFLRSLSRKLLRREKRKHYRNRCYS